MNAVRENETSTVPDGFEHLENDECISQYGRRFIPNRSDLFVVVPPGSDVSYFWDEMYPQKYESSGGWMCWGMGETCDVASLKAHTEDWKITEWLGPSAKPVPVQYCLSKSVDESCRLSMSIPLMAIVVGCNVLKLIGLGLTWFFLDKQPLLTLGGKLKKASTAVIIYLTRPVIHRCCEVLSRVS